MSTNTGHRLGEVIHVGDKNTIERLHANWEHQFTDPDFRYWEFDVNELGDGTLIVFHDRDFKVNGRKYKLKDLTFVQFRHLVPNAPTFFEVLRKFSTNYRYMIKYKQENGRSKYYVEDVKPIRIEIKRLLTNVGRDQLLATVYKFMEITNQTFDVEFIAFKSHWKKSFPKSVRTEYKDKFALHDYHVLNVKKKTKGKMHHVDLFTGNSIYGDNSIRGQFC